MARLLIGIAVLAGFVPPCSATSYPMLLLPELAGRADVIVIGTATRAGEGYRVKVTETLAGIAGAEVTFPKGKEADYREYGTKIFFLAARREGLSLIHPFTYEAPSRAEEVRRLVDMKTNPKKYLDDPKQAGSADFLEILAYAFAGRDKVGRLTSNSRLPNRDASHLAHFNGKPLSVHSFAEPMG